MTPEKIALKELIHWNHRLQVEKNPARIEEVRERATRATWKFARLIRPSVERGLAEAREAAAQLITDETVQRLASEAVALNETTLKLVDLCSDLPVSCSKEIVSELLECWRRLVEPTDRLLGALRRIVER